MNFTMDANATTPIDTAAIVQELNDEMAMLHIPATVYISILMVLGLAGNSMVFYFYGFKTRKTTNTFFIAKLAIYDIIVCAISMPTEIVDIVLYYEFTNNAACKILRFVNYVAAIASILTLIAIATDRFKKICRPTSPQMTFRHAKIVSLGIIGVSVLLSWPSLAIYGSIQVTIPNAEGLELKGSDCTSTKDRQYRKYVWMFNGVHFLMFIICSSVLIIIYSIIGRKIFTHKKQLRRHSRGPRSTSSTNETSLTEESSTSVKRKGHSQGAADTEHDKTTDNAKHDVTSGHAKQNTGDKQESNGRGEKAPGGGKKKKSIKAMKSTASNKSSGSSGINNETIKITIVMIIVTLVFIFSFLPYLSLTVWRITTGKHEAEFLSGVALVAFKIGSRSFLLNSSLNPWIYGIFNSNFRAFFFVKPFKRCCK